eukprot:ctg_6124.g657
MADDEHPESASTGDCSADALRPRVLALQKQLESLLRKWRRMKREREERSSAADPTHITRAALDEAKVLAALAYALNALFFLFLQLCGVDAAAHPVRQDLRRVQAYFTKIRDAEKR